jgi:hypothetical protein
MNLPHAAASERGIVITLNGRPLDHVRVRRTAGCFGWDLRAPDEPATISSLDRRRIAAIVFNSEGVEATWSDAAAALNRIHHGVPLIACLAISEVVHWAPLRDKSVFHSLCVPLNDREAFRR